MSDFDEVALSAARDALLNSARTVLMSAAGEDRDLPEMGVTPMVRHEGAFYIYPSHLSAHVRACLLYTSPSPRDRTRSRMPSSA